MLKKLRDEGIITEINKKGNLQLTICAIDGSQVEYSKKEALEIVGELYEIVESMPDVIELKSPDELLSDMKEKWMSEFKMDNKFESFTYGDIDISRLKQKIEELECRIFTIEMKTQDGEIIKKFINTVKRDPRLGNLLDKK